MIISRMKRRDILFFFILLLDCLERVMNKNHANLSSLLAFSKWTFFTDTYIVRRLVSRQPGVLKQFNKKPERQPWPYLVCYRLYIATSYYVEMMQSSLIWKLFTKIVPTIVFNIFIKNSYFISMLYVFMILTHCLINVFLMYCARKILAILLLFVRSIFCSHRNCKESLI